MKNGNLLTGSQIEKRHTLFEIAQDEQIEDRAEYISMYVGKRISYIRNGNLCEIYVKKVDFEKHTAIIEVDGSARHLDLLNMSFDQFYKTLLVLEQTTLNNDQSEYLAVTKPEDMNLVMPIEDDQVRYDSETGTFLGTYLRFDPLSQCLILEGNETTIINGKKTSTKSKIMVSQEEFLANGQIIKDFYIENDTAEVVIPDEYKSNPDAFAKMRFIDELISASIQTNIPSVLLLKESAIELKETGEIKSLDDLIKFAKRNVTRGVMIAGQIRTEKGTLLNMRSDRVADTTDVIKFPLNLSEQETQLVQHYTIKLMAGDSPKVFGKTYTSAYDINGEVITEIDLEIKNATDDLEKQKLINVKKALGIVVQAYFDIIDKAIDEQTVLSVEESMRNILNADLDGNPRGNVTTVMVNGYTGSGKGTTLELLNAKASESGTDGIAGRGEGFESYEEIMDGYDLARFAGEYIPNNLMRLLFATELINQRMNLDSHIRFEDPVYVSGFPRTEDQAKLFKGIKGIKAVSLEISPETAVFRTIRRMIDNVVIKQKAIRGDDLSDIKLKNANGAVLTPNYLQNLILEQTKGLNITNVNQITPDLIQQIVDQITLSDGARYKRYDSDKKKIETALNSLGVSVLTIDGNHRNPKEVAEIVKNYIEEEPVEA